MYWRGSSITCLQFASPLPSQAQIIAVLLHVLKNLNYLINRYTELLLCAGEPEVPHIGGLDLVDAHYLWLTAAKFEE